MAEESGRSRFLSKSKWGKVFKENDNPAGSGSTNAFQLTDDVVEFLKPSIEASREKQASIRAHLAPKLNIALAKSGGPDANTVRLATEADAMRAEDVPMYYTKPRRRQGLMVGFVKTVPEVIGEGGDEAPDPPCEISRQRVRVARSTSDRRPSGPADAAQWPKAEGRPPLPQQFPAQGSSTAGTEDFMAPSLRRAQTSHNEFSPMLERKLATPSIQPPAPARTLLSRTPTGFSIQQELDVPESIQPSQAMPMLHPSVEQSHYMPNRPDTRSDSANSRPRLDVATGLGPLRTSSQEPLSPAVLKQRNMSAGEGAILRRASALFMDNDEKNGMTRDPNSGIQPSADYYDKLLNMTSGSSPPRSTASRKDTVVGSQESPHFEEPNYSKRHSRDAPATSLAYRAKEDLTGPSQTSQLLQQAHSDYAPPQHSSLNPVLSQGWQQEPVNHSQIEQRPIQRLVDQPRHAPQNARISPLPTGHEQRRPGHDEHQVAGPVPVPEGQRRSLQGVRRPDNITVPGRPVPTNFSIPSPGYQRDTSRSPATREQSDSSRGSIRPANQSTEPVSGVRPGQFPYSSLQDRPTGLRRPPGQLVEHGSARTQDTHNFPVRVGSSPRLADGAAATTTGRLAARAPATGVQQDRTLHASLDGSRYSAYKPPLSPKPPVQDDGPARSALNDFGGRVAHMKGVFRLTAEKERAGDQCDSQMWLRAALWWYLVGKAGLEVMFHQRVNGAPELLTQPHVDLAKAWWIMSDVLDEYDTDGTIDVQKQNAGSTPASVVKDGVLLLKTHLQSLATSMTKNSLLPPHQSLIQGQDTKIWLQYPRFKPNDVLALNGHMHIPSMSAPPMIALAPATALPPGDSSTEFCYGRFVVDAFLSSDDADTDRIMFPCMFSMVRNKRGFQNSVVIASQTELVNIRILPPAPDANGLTWRDVSWKANTSSLHLRLPHGPDLTVRMRETDFRAVWNLVEHSRKVEHSLRIEPEERLVHEVRLEELQYADSLNASGFPQDKMRNCMARLFERRIEDKDGVGVRKAHRGYRLLLITEPGHKSLSTTSHELCRNSPLRFEFLTDAAANGTTAMVIHVNEAKRQSRILLVFRDLASRQTFYDVVVGLHVGPDETIVTKATLTGLNIESATQATSFAASAYPILQSLQWQRLGITNTITDDPHAAGSETVESESLRIIARHASGCITDRLNLNKGDMLLRLPCADIAAVQILRKPQQDLTMAIDIRSVNAQMADGIAELYHTACEQLTIRTFTFASTVDLHAFQTAITGWSILYDHMASTFGISRRRMVVPIYHKWTANHVRLQIVAQDTVVKVVAFMEEFSHADAMVIQVKSTDTFEKVKGDGKGKKWALKMVDAKFALPLKDEKKEKEKELSSAAVGGGDEQAVRRRFVNLEGLEYAGEHDDITIGFETEEARDQFAEALPAATTVGRLMTLKRRI